MSLQSFFRAPRNTPRPRGASAARDRQASPSDRTAIPNRRQAMTLQQTADASKSQYDNNGQYTRKGILRYEKIFGDGYISTGGPETTQYLCSKLEGTLRPGVSVLDVG